jgi:hypothetical protein
MMPPLASQQQQQHISHTLTQKPNTVAHFQDRSQPQRRHEVAMATESKPPFPPFTRETAQQKVKAAQAAWNTK